MLLTDTDFLTTATNIFYRLFNRKMMYAVFNGDPMSPNILFSNLSNDKLMSYSGSPEFFFHKVTIKNENFLETFRTKFANLVNIPVMLHVVDFKSTLSKDTDLNTYTIEIDNGDIIAAFHLKTNPDITISKPIGKLLTSLEVDLYYLAWKSGLIKHDDHYTTELSCKDLSDDKQKTIRIYGSNDNQTNEALAIIQPGYNIPTLNMFTKSTNNQNTKLMLHGGSDINSVMITYEYHTELLDSVGTHPGQRWFVMHTT